MIKNISNLGDSAAYCDFGSEVNKTINSNVINYFNNLKLQIEQGKIKGIHNLTPSYNKLIVSFDLSLTSFFKIKEIIQNLNIEKKINENSLKIEIPVCCDDKYGLDFDRLSKKLDLSKEKILECFFSKEYFCYMTGFIAGMPFLGDLEEKIKCDRLETPRVSVPEGSVGITEQFSNIYTFESPGGWNIIGNTPKKIFQKLNLKNPALIKPGNKIIFYQISNEEYLKSND
tara:strand:- start:198 stop:884 length:687 start_codon:yes stop_codon:yes gene_type:complete